MAEYIDREALMRRIKEIHCAKCDSYHGVRCRACWVDDTLDYIDSEPAADVAPVRHGRCDVCSGKAVLTQDSYNGYSLEIDAEQQEAAVWQGDECLAVFHIDSEPAADVAPVRHGRWLYVDTERFFLCNRCKKKEYWESNYCPNCGCKMDLEG